VASGTRSEITNMWYHTLRLVVTMTFFYVLLTVHFSIFILVIMQPDAPSWIIPKISHHDVAPSTYADRRPGFAHIETQAEAEQQHRKHCVTQC